ncbi:kappa-type opioid receptor-like [Amphiura filiformis]|uniref:kappa-type opioid receptor-like n=1 Tax=Amphiura filiformis TaxID=82378 RepID=UPI003B216B42
MTSSIAIPVLEDLIWNNASRSFQSHAWDKAYRECLASHHYYDAIIDNADFVPDYLHYMPIDRYLINIIIPCVTIFGLICNIAFLFVVWRLQRMRTATNFYLANLALADIFFLITGSSNAVISYLSSPVRGADHLGKSGCKLSMVMSFAWYYASVAIVTLVSIERYYAVLYPLKHRLMSTKRRALLIILSIWLVSFVLGLTHIRIVDRYVSYCIIWPTNEKYVDWPPLTSFCQPSPVWIYTAVHVFMIFVYLTLYLINFILCVIIIRTIHRRSNADYVTHSTRNARLSNQVTRMLIGNCTVFFICQTPVRAFALFGVLNMYRKQLNITANPDPNMMSLFLWICEILLYLNSSVNPVIYNIGSERYRTAFRETYSCNSSPIHVISQHPVVKRQVTNTTSTFQLDLLNGINVTEYAPVNIVYFETSL